MKVLNKNLAYLLIGTSSLLGVAHIAMAQQLELDPNPAPILVEGAGWVRSVAQGVSADGSVIFWVRCRYDWRRYYCFSLG
ncbi:hypothetical protein [Ochrobactrum soli]|uniref:Uncharacterized protein n=1 Tax=Ochrobactrum soli TaxID=2448455 RepID=A0A849KP84_9HYPH|nr:hypothetical protein [[Ochrobactrum] soli]NNU58736.1 hypothetical protein [[Ochrobactrum] soli]